MVKVNSVSRRSRVLGFGWALVCGSIFSFFPTAIKAAELPEIQARGSLRVAVKDNLRPLGFEDAQGNLQGFEIDLARRLAKEILGEADAVILKPVENTQRLAVVLRGEVDITIAQVTHTAARSRLVSFSPYYYLDRVAFVTKRREEVSLSQGKIAVLNQSSAIAQVRFEYPEAQLLGVNSYQEAKSVLESGKAVAFAGDETVLSGWIQEYPEYRLLSNRLGGAALAVVMPKGLQYASLRQAVNEAIRDLKRSGWLRSKAREWGLNWERER